MNTVQINTLQAGNKFTYGGNRWIVLEQNGGGALCLSEKCICDKAFDTAGNNNWAESSLRKYLNGTYLKNLVAAGAEKAAFLLFETDLTTDDGMPDYGTSTDRISLLTCDQYRKYRKHFEILNGWYWLATGDSLKYSCIVRFVYTSGALGSLGADNGSGGVRPLCNLNSSILVSIEE